MFFHRVKTPLFCGFVLFLWEDEMVKIGGFGHIVDYLQIAAAGYDFAELDIPEIAVLSGSELKDFRQKIKKGSPVLIASRLLPVTEPLFFKIGFEPESLRAYLEKACQKTAELGIRALILGNGKARSMLSPSDRQKEDVFIETLSLMAEIAAKNQQEIILEPLGPRYSNYINTIEQAVYIIQKVGKDNLFTMADLRHMVGSKDKFDSIVRYLPYIHHLHIDYPLSYPERLYPAVGDGYDYSSFFAAIKKSGYTGTLTVEADVPNNWQMAYKKVEMLLAAYRSIFI